MNNIKEEINRNKELMGLMSEQFIGPQNKPTPPAKKRYTVTYQPGDDTKYTKQEWVDGYKNAHKYLAGLLNGENT